MRKKKQQTNKQRKIFFGNSLCVDKVNRGKWVGSQVNIEEASKQAKIYIERSTSQQIYIMLIGYMNEFYNRNASIG